MSRKLIHDVPAGIVVCKFGGSSITTKADIEQIKWIMRDDPRRRIVVVSAPGKRDKDDAKVTDLLIQLAEAKDHSLLARITEKYRALDPDGTTRSRNC